MKLILSSEFGSFAKADFPSIREILRSYRDMAWALDLDLEICLGKNAENWIKNIPELDSISLRFNALQGSLVEHCIDGILNCTNPVLIQGIYPLGPIQEWEYFLETGLEIDEETSFSFCRYSNKVPGPKPALITTKGKAHLLHLFRQKKRNLLRDFDWRAAIFVAKKSIAKTSLSQRENEAI